MQPGHLLYTKEMREAERGLCLSAGAELLITRSRAKDSILNCGQVDAGQCEVFLNHRSHQKKRGKKKTGTMENQNNKPRSIDLDVLGLLLESNKKKLSEAITDYRGQRH